MYAIAHTLSDITVVSQAKCRQLAVRRKLYPYAATPVLEQGERQLGEKSDHRKKETMSHSLKSTLQAALEIFVCIS